MLEIKTLPLSFCSEEAHNVVNPEAKDYIINTLNNKYKVSIDKKHAFILNNRSIYFLEKSQHIISIKSSGTNYYLYFTRINNVNYCFFIDRKIKSGYKYPRIISVKYAFDDDIFNDTLLDGELVRDKDDNDSWIFLITDMLICEGKKLDINIVGRFNKLYSILENKYNPNFNLDICPLVVKKLFLYKDYDYLITQFIPSLPYKTNGLYFNSLNTKHANQLFLFNNKNKNRNTQVKKVTPKKENTNTNNLKIVKTDKSDIYELYCLNDAKEHSLGLACVPNLRTSKMIRKLFSNSEFQYLYVKCKFNEKFKKYEPLEKSESNIIDELKDVTV